MYRICTLVHISSTNIGKKEAENTVASLASASVYFIASSADGSADAAEFLSLLLDTGEIDYSALTTRLSAEDISNKYLLAHIAYHIDNDNEMALRYCDEIIAEENEMTQLRGYNKYDVLMLRAEIFYKYAEKLPPEDPSRANYLRAAKADYLTILNEIGWYYEQAQRGLEEGNMKFQSDTRSPLREKRPPLGKFDPPMPPPMGHYTDSLQGYRKNR